MNMLNVCAIFALPIHDGNREREKEIEKVGETNANLYSHIHGMLIQDTNKNGATHMLYCTQETPILQPTYPSLP